MAQSTPPAIPPMPPASWVWQGPSGERVTGQQVADHLTAAAALLEREGWDPSLREPFGIRQALDGDGDLRQVSMRLVDELLAHRVGTTPSFVDFESWERKAGRTCLEVQDILTATAWYARTADRAEVGR